MGETLVFLGLLVFAAHIFSMFFSKRKISDVLLLMLIGIVIGPILNLVSPSNFGSVGEVFTRITLVVILFEGALDISITDLQHSWKTTLRLTLVNALFTIVVSTTICLIFELNLMSSLIIGCALSGTAAAVVIPMSNYLKIGNQTKTALVLEAALSDVICLVSTLALIDALKLGGGLDVFKICGKILSSFIIATLFGICGSLIWSHYLEKLRKLNNSMFLIPATLILIYGVVELLGFSGAIAVFAFGITLTNIEHVHLPLLKGFPSKKGQMLNGKEQDFIGEIVFLLKTFFFVYVGLSITFENALCLICGAIVIVSLLVFRILVARFCSPKTANVFDKSIIGVMIPKGLATAVLASIPAQQGLPFGEQIRDITFAVVFFSILLCSLCVFLIENVRAVRLFLAFIFGNNNHK